MKQSPSHGNDDCGCLMPQAPDTEKSVLAMVCIDPLDIMGRCITKGVTEEWFYVPAHKILWSVFRERYEAEQLIEVTSIAQELTNRHQIEAVGGYAGLNDIFTFVTHTAFFDAHVDTLRKKYTRRDLIQTCTRCITAAYNEAVDEDTLIDQVEHEVLQVRQGTGKGEEWSLKADLRQAMQNMERLMTAGGGIVGLSTGYPQFDELTCGLKAGELCVIAARPSVGKTSFLLNIAEHVLLTLGKPALLFSCEMPSVQLVERLIHAHSGVSRNDITGQKASQWQLRKLKQTMQEMQECDVIINDTAGISISELRAQARRKLRENPDIAFIGIDYLQLMHSHSMQAQGSREREIAEISGALKKLAKDLKVPIIVLAQLNRAAENRTGALRGIPQMSDLRESGAIEQDADIIGLLYRKAYGATDDSDKQDTSATLNIVKNRNGATGEVPLAFNAALMRFEPAP